MIRISAFKWVPAFAQGHVRDLRVRWALEEAGLPYAERLLGRGDAESASYRALQPFGQVPAYEEDGLALFESGAIVLHIGETSEVLLPADPAQRERARTWVFAALNSIEPAVQQFGELDAFYEGEEWARLRRPSATEGVKKRLTALGDWLGDRDWLEERFTAGDLMMVTVLRIVADDPVLDGFPALAAYRARGEARPAFQRALAAQLRPFRENAPA